MKVLMSSYACEPGKGSEPGVGWNWAQIMQPHVELSVLTRSNNQENIDVFYTDNPDKTRLDFIYYDLPNLFLRLKKKKIISNKLYYILWQWRAEKLIRKGVTSFDVIHHVTFNVFTCPGFWWKTQSKIVLGPLGGGISVRKEYLPLFTGSSYQQVLRSWVLKKWRFIPSITKSLNRADFIMCANIDTYDLLESRYKDKMALHLETGIHLDEGKSNLAQNKSTTSIFQCIVVGSVEARKGWQLALNAVKILMDRDQDKEINLIFVGDGPNLTAAKQETMDLGIEERVQWMGKKQHDETKDLIASSDVLLFPSVRDTSGNVVLEAMSCSKPIICINHQGVAEMTSDDNAIRIEPCSINDTSEKIADAIYTLSQDLTRCRKMGEKSRARIEELFSWSSKGEFLLSHYRSLVELNKVSPNE